MGIYFTRHGVNRVKKSELPDDRFKEVAFGALPDA